MPKWLSRIGGWFPKRQQTAAEREKTKPQNMPPPEIQSLAFKIGGQSVKVINMVRRDPKFMVHKILGKLTDIGIGKFSRKTLRIIEPGFAEMAHVVFLVNETAGVLTKADVEQRFRNKNYFIGKRKLHVGTEPQIEYFVVFTAQMISA